MKLKAVTGLLLIVLLTGCSADSGMSDYKGNTRYFRTISDEINGEIVYDTRTGVEYWRSDGYSNVLTVLVNADGKPLIYDRSVEK
jgi:hypothetical protein